MAEMMQLTKWADTNAEITDVAGSLAWGALKMWFMARDQKPPFTSDDLQSQASDIGLEWRERTFDDPTEAIALEILARRGFRIASGSCVNDATVAKI